MSLPAEAQRLLLKFEFVKRGGGRRLEQRQIVRGLLIIRNLSLGLTG